MLYTKFIQKEKPMKKKVTCWGFDPGSSEQKVPPSQDILC